MDGRGSMFLESGKAYQLQHGNLLRFGDIMARFCLNGNHGFVGGGVGGGRVLRDARERAPVPSGRLGLHMFSFASAGGGLAVPTNSLMVTHVHVCGRGGGGLAQPHLCIADEFGCRSS